MSNTITSGVIEAPINSVPIGSETAENQSPSIPSGAGEADSQNQTGEPGDSVSSGADNSSADGASPTGQRRSRSQLSTIHELRQDRRELRAQLEQSIQQIQEMRDLIASLQSSRSPASSTGPEVDEAAFWNSPLKTLRSELTNGMTSLEKRLMQAIQTSRQQESEQSALQQETSEAVKFVRSQKGWTPDDEGELIEVIEENGLKSLPPMKRAEIALTLLQQQRGITNKAPMKARASTVVGMAGGGGKKIWARAEVESLLDQAMSDPSKLTKELEQEILSAEKEGRIK